MKGYNWDFAFNPSFPLHIFNFTVEGNRDPMHWHYYFEIGLCVKGTGNFVYLNQIYPVKEGDVFYSGNYESHVAISEEGEQTEYLFLIFMPSLIAPQECSTLNREYLEAFSYNPLMSKNKIDAATPAAKKIGQLIRGAYEIYTESGSLHQMQLDIILRQILSELTIDYRSRLGVTSVIGHVNHPKITAALEYINNHYTEQITLKEVSDSIQINESYFRHLFKDELQITFKSYLTFLRLSQAKKLLIATNMSISEIIHECGYTNASQFYRVFQKNCELTPAEYRRYYQAENEESNAVVLYKPSIAAGTDPERTGNQDIPEDKAERS